MEASWFIDLCCLTLWGSNLNLIHIWLISLIKMASLRTSRTPLTFTVWMSHLVIHFISCGT